MIDLRHKGLPSRIEWDGGSAAVLTDFRVWIEFARVVSESDGKSLWTGVFPGGVPPEGDAWQDAAIAFMQCANSTPRMVREPSRIKAIDLVEDGAYIVAAFQQAYGIDLTSADMHWHRFRALLDGIPDDTQMARIMGWRSYDPASADRKHDAIMREQRAAWALPVEEQDDGMGGFGALLGMIGG